MLKQILSVTWLNLTNLGSRIGISLVIVVGIGGVVAVLLGLLAMSNGFRSTLMQAVHPDRVLLLRSGSNNEMESWVSNEDLAVLATYEGLQTLSPEVYVTINVQKQQAGTMADVVGRGVTASALQLRSEVEITAGRMFQPGTGEILAGTAAVQQFRGLNIGDRIRVRDAELTVVGHFSAAGAAAESELWMDLPVARDVFRRTGASVVRAAVTEPAAIDTIAANMAADPRLSTTLVTEQQYFAAMAGARTALMETFAYLIAGIMALGSVVAALNTMYTAVNRRTLEIGTLRALGFQRPAVVISVVTEAMVLALLGALLGAAAVYLVFDGMAAATVDGAGASVAFAFSVSPDMLLTAVMAALLLGFAGGSLPALQAARMPITRALRG